MPSYKSICLILCQILHKKHLFSNKMTSMTFDLWPHDPKISVNICLVTINLHAKLQVHMSKSMSDIVQKLYFYKMTSVTFDLWTCDPKIQPKYCPPRIHPQTKFDVEPSHCSKDIDKNKTGRTYGRTDDPKT